jgi:S1-C subfamily serine protease
MYIKDQEILGQVIYDDPTFDLAFIAIDVEDTFNHVVIDLSLKMEVNEIVQSTRKFNNDSKIVFGTILDFDRVPIIDGNPLISDVTFPVFSIQLESEYGISGSPVYNMDYEFIGITYAVNLQKNALSRVYVIPIEDIQVFIYNFLDQ